MRNYRSMAVAVPCMMMVVMIVIVVMAVAMAVGMSPHQQQRAEQIHAETDHRDNGRLAKCHVRLSRQRAGHTRHMTRVGHISAAIET